MLGRPLTVFDRTKKTGYMMGSGHQMGPAMNADDPNTDNSGTGASSSDDGGSPAPNYRDADGMESCGTCSFFGQDAHCEKFDFQTKPDMVCDGYEDKDDDEAGESDAAGTDSSKPPIGV